MSTRPRTPKSTPSDEHPFDWSQFGSTAEAKRKKAEMAARLEGYRVFGESVKDMVVLPMEDKANFLLSYLTQGAMECLSEASVLIPHADVEVPQSARWKAPDARSSRRNVELQNLARLGEAGGRIMDAFTNLRRTYNRQINTDTVRSIRHKDGSLEQVRVNHRSSIPGPRHNFDPNDLRPGTATAESEAGETAANEN